MFWDDSAKFKDIKSVTQSQKIFPFDKTSTFAKADTRLYQKIIDMRKPSGKIYNIGGKKTPLSYSFVDDMADKIDDIATKTTKIGKTKAVSSDLTKVIDKLDDFSARNTGVKISKYRGTGQYEQSFGGFDMKTVTQNQLKFDITPQQIKTFKLKDIIKVKHLTHSPKIKFLQLGQLAVLKNNVFIKIGYEF